MMIKREVFEKRFRQLVYVTKQIAPGQEISFCSGLWFDEEGYKLKYWQDARDVLQLDEWEHITDKEIVSLAMKPFGILIEGSYRKQQNLVSKENYLKLFDLFYERLNEAVAALKEIFFGVDEKAAFEKMSALLSKKSMNDPLSVISLFFFLKDNERYVTARKQGTAERICKLDVSAACVQNCTWDGYQQYLEIVRDIQGYLPKSLNASFLDAQSFLWMLWRVENNTPECEWKDDGNSYVDEVVIHKGTPLSVDQWEESIRDGLINEEDIKYLAKFYAYPDHAVSCSELGRYEGKYYTAYNKRAKDIGDKVGKRFGLPPMYYEDGVTDLYFPVEFLWRKDQAGNIVWRVRPELAQALENVCPEVLGVGIEEYQEAEREAAEKCSDDELHARAVAAGSYAPVQYSSKTTQYRRNEYIAADAKRRAAGKCQLCGETPFFDKKNNAYLEVHHIVWLSEGGADALENVVALCPNCHRKMHINPDDADIRKLKDMAAGMH